VPDKFTKAIMADQSHKEFQQDTDDGLLFFHTHSLWDAMQKLEKFYECKIYGVLELQEVHEELRWLNDENSKVEKLTKKDILDAIEYAYDKVDGCNDGHNQYLEVIEKYLEDTGAL